MCVSVETVDGRRILSRRVDTTHELTRLTLRPSNGTRRVTNRPRGTRVDRTVVPTRRTLRPDGDLWVEESGGTQTREWKMEVARR